MLVKNKESIASGLAIIKAELMAKIEACPDGLLIEITEFKPKRTSLQNSFYWANIKDVTEILREHNITKKMLGFEILITYEDVHEINKAQFNITTTTKLSKKEFCDFMDSMFAFWIEKTKGKWTPKELARTYLEKTGAIS